MTNLEHLVNKEGLTVLGSLIKLNRIAQNMSQQVLCKGICVPSYLSKIENGEVVPSLEMIELLFEELAIDYCQDYDFINQMQQQFQLFFEELNFNGFTTSREIFIKLEKVEKKIRHSPLIVDYYLVKLAYYCGTSERCSYEEAYELLSSIQTLLSPSQRYQFYFYQGIDQLYYYHDYSLSKKWLLMAKQEHKTGQVYEMLAIVNFKLGSYYESLLQTEKALQHFIEETNLVCLAGIHDFQALLAYKLGSFEKALELVERAKRYGEKINRQDLILTSLLTEAFLFWRTKHKEKMDDILLTFHRLKKELQVDWPILITANFLEQCAKDEYCEQEWVTLQSNTSSLLHPALNVIRFCLCAEKKETWRLNGLLKDYQAGLFRHILLDELVEVVLKDYYRQTRQYKEIDLLYQISPL